MTVELPTPSTPNSTSPQSPLCYASAALVLLCDQNALAAILAQARGMSEAGHERRPTTRGDSLLPFCPGIRFRRQPLENTCANVSKNRVLFYPATTKK